MKTRKITLEFVFYDDDKESMKMTTTEIFDEIINSHSKLYNRCYDLLIKDIDE